MKKLNQPLLRYSSFFVLLFACSISLFGQGTVQGNVTGSDVGEALISATIFVKGTTTGTVSDYNGHYILPLREGDYTLQISYMGYETQEQDIQVIDGQITELNVELAPSSIMGEEVIITAQARGQLAAVNQQLRANQIVNVVSKERIKELPDENAAQAISRLPGVHLDGSKVVIRGIQPKMNKIMINGVVMPSTEANNRASDLGFISANQLSGIEVFKTLTPNMDADAIGGVVNLTLAEAQPGFNSSLTLQGAYNAQENLIGSSKIWADVSKRFLDSKIGVSVNMNYEIYQGGSDRISPSYTKLGGGDVGEARYMFANLTVQDNLSKSNNLGANVVVDYKLPGGKIVYTGMFTRTDGSSIMYTDLLGANNGFNQRYITLDHSATKTSLLNNSLRFEQQLGILKIKASASAISVKKADDFDYEFRFNDENDAFDVASLTNEVRLVMDPWEMYDYEIEDAWENLRAGIYRWTPEKYDERQYLADLDVELPLKLHDQVSVVLRAGGKYRFMKRDFDQSSLTYNSQFTETVHAPMSEFIQSVGQEAWQGQLQFIHFRDYDYAPNDGFMGNSGLYNMQYVMDVDYAREMAVDLIDPSTLIVSQDEWRNDYWGDERLSAAYAMAEINLWSRLLIIPGIRFEKVQNNYTGTEVVLVSQLSSRVVDTISKPASHSHLLPHLHARLKVTDWMDLRFSYNNTLARPDYNFALPSVYYDIVSTSGVAGNPYIEPSLSKNLDANITLYSKRIGLLTLGGFMKTIEGVFYMQPTLIANIPDTTIRDEFPTDVYPALAGGDTDFYINNPYPAYLRGLEVEWQSNFTWLPKPFNGIVLNVNYTHVWSETKYVQHRLVNQAIPTPPFVQQVESDTFYVNRLLHQANDIANISLGYDLKGFSARLSFRFQGNVISNISSRSEENTYTNDVYKFDFVAKQRIPMDKLKMEVFFNAINFTNVPFQRYSIYPNKGETNVYTRYSGARFQLGLRITI